MTFTNVLRMENAKPIARDLTIVILSSFLIGLFGKIAIPLPFTPVPVATQGSLILLLSVLLGPRRATAAVLAFLFQGAVGLPVFAGGVGGIAKFLGPTGGYFIGYLAAAYLTGTMMEKMKEKTYTNAFLAMTAGNLVCFFFGALYLSTFVGFQKALLLGVVPFILGDLFKIFAGLKILQWIRWNRQA